jgi:hypothetical protein
VTNFVDVDMESYNIPPVLRRALKISKTGETIMISSNKRQKLLGHLENPIFSYDQIREFKK